VRETKDKGPPRVGLVRCTTHGDGPPPSIMESCHLCLQPKTLTIEASFDPPPIDMRCLPDGFTTFHALHAADAASVHLGVVNLTMSLYP
jgi:hypothetical protein